MTSDATTSLARNPKLFLLFRVFFNARFYYPVYAILFLDFGLSVEQFAVLNFAWALTIVILEVPSGGIADQFGRKFCVVVASVLMILEMLVLCLTPVGAGSIVFYLFLVNRILSGAAEAAASGADEALAYDSIPESNRAVIWPRLMVRLIRYQATAFIFVAIIGAAAYDADFVNIAAERLGSILTLDPSTTLKFPLYLTLAMGFVTLGVSLAMVEAPHSLPAEGDASLPESARAQVGRSFKRILEAGAWILRTPAPLILLLIGLFYDSIVRLYYTINSSYFRLLHIEEAWFGVIGAVASIVGLLSAGPVEKLANRCTPVFNFRLVTILIFAGLASLFFAVPYYGVIFIAPLWIAMRYLHFFVSHYLNLVTDSHHRATVLSFRGLAMNLSYGFVTLLFGLHTRFLREGFGSADGNTAPLGESDLNQLALAASIKWWAPYFAATAIAMALIPRWKYRSSLTTLIDRARNDAR